MKRAGVTEGAGLLRRTGASLLAWAIVAHVVFGLLRLPHAVVGKRLDEIDAFRRDGDAAWLLRESQFGGAEAIHQLRTDTDPHAIVAIRGTQKGPMEFAPALLWPRLCVFDDRLPRGATTFAGRPLAPLALVSDGRTLHLEPR